MPDASQIESIKEREEHSTDAHIRPQESTKSEFQQLVDGMVKEMVGNLNAVTVNAPDRDGDDATP